MVVNTLLKDLETQLNFIHLETDDNLRKAELSVNVIQTTLQKLKSYVIKQKFKSQQEEINFFKRTGSKVFIKLIYYVKLYNSEISNTFFTKLVALHSVNEDRKRR